MITHVGGLKPCKAIDPSGAMCIKKGKIENSVKNIEETKNPSVFKPPRVQRPLEPTHKGLDLETIKKAKLVEASKIAYKNGFNEAQTYLDDAGLGHTIDTTLSSKDSLVLLGDDDKVRIIYRGTDVKNLKDVSADAAIAVGQEAHHPLFKNAEAQLTMAKTTYGGVDELIGYSLGGSKAISMGVSHGIATTSFNPFLGPGQLMPRGKHTVWRTTEDFASLGVGLGGNFDVKSVHPHVDKLNPVEAHELSNFSEVSERRAGITQELAAAVRTQGQRAGEFELLDAMAKSDETYTRFLHKFNGEKGVDSDGIQLLGKRNHSDSKMVRYWKEAGKEFTEAEHAHIRSNSRSSSTAVRDATTAEERAAFLKKPDRARHIEREHARLRTAAKAVDAHTRPHVSAKNMIKRMAHPTTLGLGLGVGALTSMTLDPILPDGAQAPVEGAVTGTVAEAAGAALAGRALTGFALGVGGAAGFVSAGAGVGVDAGVEAVVHGLGASDDVTHALGETAGGAAAGAAGIGAASVLGAELGAIGGPLGLAAGASVGAALGFGGWLIGKLLH